MVQLDQIDNTSDSEKPTSTATRTALDPKANQADVYTKEGVDAKIDNLVSNAPVALNTLKELAQAWGDNESFSSTVISSIATKAPSVSPIFTGSVSMYGGLLCDGYI